MSCFFLLLVIVSIFASGSHAASFDWPMVNTTVALCANAYCETDTYLTRTYTGYAAGFVATKAIDNKKDVQVLKYLRGYDNITVN